MNAHVHGFPRFLLIAMFLGLFLSVAPGVGAEKVNTDAPVSDRVAIARSQCLDNGGTFETYSGTNEATGGAFTSTLCDYGNDFFVACEFTATTTDCRKTYVPESPDGDVAAPAEADTLAPTLRDPTPIVTRPTLVPTTTPVADPRG